MTAAEIARHFRRRDLATILEATIYHHVAQTVLDTLQDHFHALIRKEVGPWTLEFSTLRLPDLVVLTELKSPLMWFPLKSTGIMGRAIFGLDERTSSEKRARVSCSPLT